MNTQADGSKAQYWQKHIAEWKLSGLSQHAYCEQQGIRYTTFGYYRGVLNKQKNTTTTSFIEVKPSMTTPPKSIAIQFILPNGVKIGIPVQAGKEVIAHVLSEIGKLPC